MTHDIKCHPTPFDAMWNGQKKHEVRKTDRDYNLRDVLHLKEWDPAGRFYTGREMIGEVTYVTRQTEFGLPSNICVMTVKVQTRIANGVVIENQ